MPDFKKTPKQEEANQLLQGDAQHTLLRGGSRSGKTFILVRALVVRSLKTKSRHLILRKHFAHVKQAIWYDTLPTVLDLCYPGLKEKCQFNKSDWFVTFPNGSELWFGGLDDKERTDKILGKEYSTIYFNECSEMSYQSVCVAHTRLAQKNSLRKKFYYDCNPPKETHWSNLLFIQKLDPNSQVEEALPDPDNYATMRLNPADNEENLDAEYMGILSKLPPALRLRFLHGEYGSDDSDIIQPAWIIPSEPFRPEDVAAKFSFCDPAYTEKARATDQSCESSIVTVAVTYDNLIHEIEFLHGLWSYEKLKENCKSVYARHSKAGQYIFGIEDVAAQRWLHEDLMRPEVGVFTVLIKPDGDKVRRTISVTDLMEQGRTRVNDPLLQKQCLGFPGERLKDGVDSYVGCLKLVKRYAGEYKRASDETFPTYEDRVHRYMRMRRERLLKARKSGGSDPTLGKNW